MGFKIHPDGSITTDDIEGAIALSKRLAGRHRAGPAETREQAERAPKADSQRSLVPRSPKVGVPALMNLLNENQSKLVKLLQVHGKLRLDDIARGLGYEENRAVTGVISGVVKNANKAGVDPQTVFVRSVEGGVVYYAPGSALLGTPDSAGGGA